MFTATMNEAEIQREAWKDFFELSSKTQMAFELFSRKHFNLIKNSELSLNEHFVSLISKVVETKKWSTRKKNTWISFWGVKTNNLFPL